MTKKSVKLLKNVKPKNSSEYLPEDIARLTDAISLELDKIKKKGNELVIDDNHLMVQLHKGATPSRAMRQANGVLGLVASASLLSMSSFIGGFISSSTLMSSIIGFGISFGFISGVVISFGLISGIVITEDDLVENLLKPSLFYRLKLKLFPHIAKKYQIAQQNYYALLLQAEEYDRYAQKKLELITPALDVLNEYVDGVELSVDRLGNIHSKDTPREENRSKLESIVLAHSPRKRLGIAQ